jgi:hypothetical protein
MGLLATLAHAVIEKAGPLWAMQLWIKNQKQYVTSQYSTITPSELTVPVSP